MNDKMKNLVVRTLSGLVLVVLVVGATLWSQWSFGALLALLLVGGLAEFYALAAACGARPQRVIGTIAGLVLLLSNFAFVSEDILILGSARHWFGAGLAFLLLSVCGMFVCELFRKNADPIAAVGTTLAGICYVALPVSLLCYVPLIGSADWAWNPWIVIAYLCIIWANDVFAYLVGMAFGKHRLCERLSPKKSWEGFFGGLAGAIAAGVIAARLLDDSLCVWGGLALVAAIAGVLGDLAESMFKRAAGVKDSGRSIPGHGGVLDRFDALLLSAPFVFVYMLFVM